jgi:hypothetical protein
VLGGSTLTGFLLLGTQQPRAMSLYSSQIILVRPQKPGPRKVTLTYREEAGVPRP